MIILEVFCRIIGLKPYSNQEYPYKISGSVNNLFVPDTGLGFRMNPGEFIIEFDEDHLVKMSNNRNGNRLTSIEDFKTQQKIEDIWFLGCSYTYGWSLNDEETFCYKLQSEVTQKRIVNYAQPAYSGYQCYLKLKEQLRLNAKPAKVYYIYAAFHDERNIAHKNWIQQLSAYKHLGSIGIPNYQTKEIEDLSIKASIENHSALFHNILRYFRSVQSREEASRSSLAIICQMDSRCQKRSIDFEVVIINSDKFTKKLKEQLEQKGITVLDYTIDTRLAENTNLPYDSHPSASANEKLAQKLQSIID